MVLTGVAHTRSAVLKVVAKELIIARTLFLLMLNPNIKMLSEKQTDIDRGAKGRQK